MKDMKNVTHEGNEAPQVRDVSRRRFLGYAGGIAGAGILLAGCDKKENTDPAVADGAADLGSNDEGLLNLLLVITQVQADYYEKMLSGYYTGINNEEIALYLEMQKHEIAHREFLRNYLKGRGATVKTDLSIVDFSSKQSVLSTLELLENLGVAAMNEISRLLVSVEHVAMVLKMSSLQARHACTISNILSLGAYYNTVDVTGAEQGILPSNVVNTINRYLSTKVSGNNLPNK